MSNKTVIGVAGSGWGFWAALKGLTTHFEAFEIFNTAEESDVEAFVKNNLAKDCRVIDTIEAFGASTILCSGLKQIIGDRLLNEKQFINIHYSLLPKYRGLHSTVWAILNNEPLLGYTVHLMNAFIDDGPIVFQHSVSNNGIATAPYYLTEFNKHVEANIGKVLNDFLTGTIKAIPQNKSAASWVAKRTLEDCMINFNSTYDELTRLYRALDTPYPRPFFILKGNMYQPRVIRFQASETPTQIGRILNNDDEGVWVKIKDGYCILNDILTNENEKCDNQIFKIGQWLNK